MSLCEQGLSRHLDKICALSIRLVSSQRMMVLKVWFDARGYGLRGADQSHPHLWVLTMAMQFQTTDQRYQWLNTTLGVLVSEFDEQASRGLWRAFVPKVES